MDILIITGGRIDEDFALGFLYEHRFSHIIVVDGALAFWDKVEKKFNKGLKFDHLVGDFDTISPDILEKYQDREDITVHRFIPEKDYTDTDIAAKLAVDLGREEAGSRIFFLGATGSRADHSLANIQLLKYIHDRGQEAFLVDANNRIRLISGKTVLKKKDLFGYYLSLIPLSERIESVTMRGVKYEVTGLEVVMGQTRCVSNEVTADECSIDIGGGIAWLIESRD